HSETGDAGRRSKNEGENHGLSTPLARRPGLTEQRDGDQHECQRVERTREALVQFFDNQFAGARRGDVLRCRVQQLAQVTFAGAYATLLGPRLEIREIDAVALEHDDLRGLSRRSAAQNVAALHEHEGVAALLHDPRPIGKECRRLLAVAGIVHDETEEFTRVGTVAYMEGEPALGTGKAAGLDDLRNEVRTDRSEEPRR